MLKRLFDITTCLIAFPFLLPFFAITAIAIRLGSSGPVFYRGWRTGLGGNPFRIFKFRTMVVDAEKIGGPSTALNDPRLTRIGKFLRKYKIDELPQLINILTGEMSFVGPRPQVEKYTKLYNDEEQIILSVHPGLTDYASIELINLDQILGDDAVDEKYLREIEPEKNRLRMKYAREHSFLIDFKIILMTLTQMFKIESLWNIKK
ncbi:MAG: sugar transferase [Deltaproteobacteria bacterium]|jgi:lipopolysaccharide/colanic/teichoic acid biosynthesis glycosyltransferase|nr:sugar transferase [Deltaproteobacteria bacterium]